MKHAALITLLITAWATQAHAQRAQRPRTKSKTPRVAVYGTTSQRARMLKVSTKSILPSFRISPATLHVRGRGHGLMRHARDIDGLGSVATFQPVPRVRPSKVTLVITAPRAKRHLVECQVSGYADATFTLGDASTKNRLKLPGQGRFAAPRRGVIAVVMPQSAIHSGKLRVILSVESAKQTTWHWRGCEVTPSLK